MRLDPRVHRPSKHRVAPTPKVNKWIGTIVDGKYEILRRIGAGGMGEVFEAENHVLKRRVAIKIVSAESSTAAARLRREASMIASMHHPNICNVYDVGEMPDGSPYLVLELLEGETLNSLLRRCGRLSSSLTVEFFTQLLSSLQQAHAIGIVHRDLKPANVFLVERVGCRPLVKLLDFGLAKDVSGRYAKMTRPGEHCGTPGYMSPEQLTGKTIDHRSDLFSVGTMLFECLTGRHPFAAATVAETSIQIVHDPPSVDLRSLPFSLPPGISEILARALQKAPELRYASAVQMQMALQNLRHLDESTPESETAARIGLPHLASSE
jgi:serine/threonine-protein kinase